MDKKQRINCTVESCRYNNGKNKICELDQIVVTPKQDISSATPEESECSSYKAEL